MYPPGHIAFAYLLAKPIVRNQPSVAELAALTCGSLFPAAGNMTLQNFHVFGISSGWAHSPLLLGPLLILGFLAYWMPIPYSRVPLLFALGFASHLVIDILFAFPLIYFSDSTDDVGGSWFYPWRPIIINYEKPGFNIQPWELILEGLFLLGTLRLWGRRDLWLYAAGVVVVTGIWIMLPDVVRGPKL